MNGDVLKMLKDIKNSLLGIALMLVGLSAFVFGIVADNGFFLYLGIIVQLCGFVKAVNAWLAHEVVDVPDKKPFRPTESSVPEFKISSDKPVSPKED